MKIIGAIFLLIVFVSPIYAQDLFDRAEIEFNIDYIDIDKVKLLGSKNKGKVMAVWMKSGSVLTKTLSKSSAEYGDSGDQWQGLRRGDLLEGQSPPYPGAEKENIWEMSTDELRVKANTILSSEWVNKNDMLGSGYTEEVDLLKILTCLKHKENKGPEFVGLAMDIIAADLKRGSNVRALSGERIALEYFAANNDILTKMANDFLEENGFNKEK